MTDFLDEKHQEIRYRLAELKAAMDEYQRLEQAASALESISGTVLASAPRRGRPPGSGRKPGRPPGSGRKPGRPRGSGRKTAPPATAGKTPAAAVPAARTLAARKSSRPGRRKGSGSRQAEALVLVQKQPGISIPELATGMGIKQNYLYRVMPQLLNEGKVAKQGRGWHPVAATAAS